MHNRIAVTFFGLIIRDVFGVFIIAALSLCLGLLINRFYYKPLPMVYQSKAQRLDDSVNKIGANSHLRSTRLESLPEQLTLDEFAEYVRLKKGIVLDARPEIFHRLGHVPGALSLPRDDFYKGYDRLRATLERSKEQPVVVYCSSLSCEDSELVQRSLVKLGYNQVAVFKGGWAEWTEAKFPEEGLQ